MQLPQWPHYTGLLFKLIDLLTGKERNENIQLKSELRFVNHISESNWRSMFWPMTVKGYINKYGNPESNVTNLVYEHEDMKQETKICRLPGSPKKILSLLTTFSWTDKIVFDLAGVDPLGGQRAYEMVKKQLGNTGAAILIDHCDEFKNDCTQFVKFEMADKIISD